MLKKFSLKKTFVEKMLDKANISYESIELNGLDPAKLPNGIMRSDIYKTLALFGDKTGTIVAVLPLTERLSEKKLAKVSGNKKAMMIPQKDLQGITGYIHGANNPIGIHQTKHFPIFIDKIALEKEFIYVSAGEIGRSLKINPKDLGTFVNAKFLEIKNDK